MAGDAVLALVTSFLGSMGFGIMLHVPRKALLPASALGAVSYMVFWLLSGPFLLSPAVASLAASITASVLSQLAARRLKMIALVFLVTALIPLVPGMGLYQSMVELARGDNVKALITGIEAMKVVLMIALGMGFGTFVFGSGPKKRPTA